MSNLLGKNENELPIIVRLCSVYTISSDDTECIIVENANHQKFKSFKYILDGENYYYIVDNLNTEWTNNLSSLGYTEYSPIPIVHTAYFAQGEGNSLVDGSNTFSEWGGVAGKLSILDSDVRIPWNSTKTYTVLKVFKADGSFVDKDTIISGMSALYTIGINDNDSYYGINHTGVLCVRFGVNCKLRGSYCGVEYTEE